MADLSLTTNIALKTEYILFLPGGKAWAFNELTPDAYPKDKFAVLYAVNAIRIPIDLITAARLRLIKPGDDSGVGDEQWAWLRLIGLT